MSACAAGRLSSGTLRSAGRMTELSEAPARSCVRAEATALTILEKGACLCGADAAMLT